MSEDHTTLIEQARQGDQEALAELYRQTRDMAFFTAMRYVKNREDAADVIQNAYIAAFRKLHTFDEQRSFEPWLRKIVVNQALNFLRDQKGIDVGEDLIEEVLDDEDLIPSYFMEQKEKRETILEFVNALPDGQRLAITLYYFEGMSVAEIADIMGVKPGTAKSHLHFGRKAIKAAILEEEQRGNKLYAFLPIPVLSQIFQIESQQAEMPVELSERVLFNILQSLALLSGVAAPAASGLLQRMLAARISVRVIVAALALCVAVSSAFLAGRIFFPQGAVERAQPAPGAEQEIVFWEETQAAPSGGASELTGAGIPV